MKKILLALLLIVCAPICLAQTAAIQRHSYLGGTHAVTSGLPSANYLNGIIPSATITVYLTGTTTLATIYKDAENTPLSNPFTSNSSTSIDPGGWIFWAAVNQGYDIVMSGGIPPNTYLNPVTLVDQFPGFEFSGGGGCTSISSGGDCVTNDPTVTQAIVQPNSTEFSYTDPSGNGETFHASATTPKLTQQFTPNGQCALFSQTDSCFTGSYNTSSLLGGPGYDITILPEVTSAGNKPWYVFGAQYNFDYDAALLSTADIYTNSNFFFLETGSGSTTDWTSGGVQFASNIYWSSNQDANQDSSCNGTLKEGNDIFFCKASDDAQLPAVAANSTMSPGFLLQLTFEKYDATGTVTITPAAGDTIAGASSMTLTSQYQTVTLYGDGHHTWYVAGSSASGGGGGGIGGSGTTGYLPEFTASTTIGNSHIDDGVTAAGKITATEPVAVNAPSSPSQIGMTYNSNALAPGSSTTAVLGVNASGQGLLSEAGGAASRICTAANGVCNTPAIGGIQVEHVFTGAGNFNFAHNLNDEYPVYSCYSKSGATAFTATPVDANNMNIAVSAAADILCSFLPTVQLADFSFTVTPSTYTYTPTMTGTQSPTFAISQTAISGYSGTATYSTSGLASGMSSSYSPTTITGSGSSTLTVSFPATQAAGLTTITTSATDGTHTHTNPLNLTISDINSGLLDGWQMQEGSGTTFNDATANANNQTFASSIGTWGNVAGLGANSFTFNGTGFSTGSNQTLTNFNGSTPFSVSFWMNPTSVSTQQAIVSTIDTANNFVGWEVGITSATSPPSINFFAVNTYPSNALQVHSTVTGVTAGALQFVVVTYSGSKTPAGVAIYLNGNALGTSAATNTLTGSTANTKNVMLGGRLDGTIPFSGALGYVRIYNRVLSAADVTAMYAAGPR